MRRARLVLGLVGAASLALAACQLIVKLDDESGATRPAEAGAQDAGAQEAGAAPATTACLPGPPPPDAASIPTGGEAIFVLRSVNFTTAVGFDLDCRDTQKDADLPCRGSPDDLALGLDNGVSQALLNNGVDVTSFEQRITDLANAGTQGILLHVSKLDLPPSHDVTGIAVAFTPSNGMDTESRCDLTPVGDAGPHWDGCDRWTRVYDFTVNVSTVAYITGTKLVARYSDPKHPLTLRLAEVTVTLNDAIVTADLVTTDGGVGLDGGVLVNLANGVIAGRIKTSDMILASGYISSNGARVCDNPSLQAGLKRVLCQAQDLPSEGRGSAGETCDSLSIALAFDAVFAQRGGQPIATSGDAAPCPEFDASCN